ncbi:MAG TPA: UDP-glucose 4-epimerase GalE, partial [Streptosporangiaceae bacterium]
VTDLAAAHLRALVAARPGEHRIYNLGNGAGFSVREVIEVCREVTGIDIAAEVGPRRAGDPAVLVASAAKIQSELGWRASRDLRAMAADAWQFTQARSSK